MHILSFIFLFFLIFFEGMCKKNMGQMTSQTSNKDHKNNNVF